MACFHPIEAWKTEGERKLAFRENGGRRLLLPCGRCIGCRDAKAQEWAMRCMHEASMHEKNCFVTLTYSDENYTPSLRYGDFQRFMYRLRGLYGPVRFYMCGEYGERTKRAHYHALFFGQRYGERALEKAWRHGFVVIGDVTYESSKYVARYCTKKRDGDSSGQHYSRMDVRTGEIVTVEPEFSKMSLKPGIGASWLDKYWKEVYKSRDGIVLKGGKTIRAPRYYDKILARDMPELMTDKEVDRWKRSLLFREDTTEQRLLDKEICSLAKRRFLKEGTI